jgi:hypothetical protein
MSRRSLRTEIRARENLEVLGQYVDESRISLAQDLGETYKTPAQILSEYWQWANRATAYQDLAILEATGRLIHYPLGAQNYRRGFKIDTTSQKSLNDALEKDLQEHFDGVKESLAKTTTELETIIKGLGWLATSRETEWKPS